MVTPHRSPSFSSVPHPTPASAYQTSRIRKAPILNPYDKFTRPEFEEWINDITGALRRALGQEPVLSASPDSKIAGDRSRGYHDADQSAASDAGSENSQGFEDSFADIKTRRAKGKARDPREGPGLGSHLQPIDIGSESEEEVGYEDDSREDLFEEGEDNEELGQDVEDVEDEEWEGESSSPTFENSPRKDDHRNTEGDVIELTSDEEEGSEDVVTANEQGFHDTPSIGYDYSENLFSEDEQDADIEDDFPPVVDDSYYQPPEISDPWEGPKTYAEDYYSGGDLRDIDLNHGKPSPSNLTPLRQEWVESHPIFVLDDDLADSSTSPSSLAERADAVTIPKDLCADHDIDQYKMDDGDLEELDDVDKDDVDWALSHDEQEEDSDMEAEPSDLLDVDIIREQAPVLAQDAGDISGIDSVNVKKTSIDNTLSFDVDNIMRGKPVGMEPETAREMDSKPKSGDQYSVDFAASDSPSDFGILPDSSPELGSAPLEEPLDMTGVLSFLAYDDEDESLEFEQSGADDERNLVGSDDIHSEVNVAPAREESRSAEEHVHDVTIVEDGNGRSLDEPFTVSAEQSFDQTTTLDVASGHLAAQQPSSDLVSEAAMATAEFTPEQIVDSSEIFSEQGEMTTSSRARTPDISRTADALHMTSPAREMRNGIPMPVSADPNVPDPTDNSSPSNNVSSSPGRAPMFLSLPGTPAILLSPVGTPGLPTPISVPVPSSVLRAMQLQQSLSANSASGLFTPANGSESVPGTPRDQPEDAENPEARHAAPADNSTMGDASSTPLAKESSPDDGKTVVLKDDTVDGITNGKVVTDGDLDMVNHSDTDETSRHEEDAENGDRVTRSPSHREPDETTEVSSLRMQDSDNQLTSNSPVAPVVYLSEPTTPTLHADPYPYSLSTPRAALSIFDQSMKNDEGEALSDEENEISLSPTSSIVKNEAEAHKLDSNEEMAVDGDDSEFELFYPVDSAEEAGDIFVAPNQGGTDVDTGSSVPRLDTPQDQPTDAKATLAVSPHNVRAGDDGSQVVADRDRGDREPVTENTSDKAKDAEDERHVGHSSIKEVPPREDAVGDRSNDEKSRLSRSMNHSDGVDDLEHSPPSRELKKSPPSPKNLSVPPESPGPVTRPNIPESTREKGKGKIENEGGRDNQSAAGSRSTSSGASTALRMLQPGSQITSRASSVEPLSSEASSFSPVSPSANQFPGNVYESPIHSHLFHAHGAARQQQMQPQLLSAVPLDQAKPITPPRAKNPQTEHLSRSESIIAQRSTPSPSSPVTRSNCRFHRISIPLEEGGPRVYFLVPGCSLGDKKLMEIQDIRDHGFATSMDGRRIIRDLEPLDFSSELLGILRQLVGVDLLREQEVLYLPQSGKDHVQKELHKSVATRLSFRDASSAGVPPVSPRVERRSLKLPNLSISTPQVTVSTDPRNDVELEQGSWSESSLSDMESDHSRLSSPSHQRTTRSNKDATTTHSASQVTPPSSAKVQASLLSKYPAKVRRSKRLDADAHAYKPPAESERDTSEGENHGRRSKLKRTRTGEATTRHDESDRKKKQKRLRLTSSAAGAEQA